MKIVAYFIVVVLVFSACQSGGGESGAKENSFHQLAAAPVKVTDSIQGLDIYNVGNLYKLSVPMNLHRSDAMQEYQSLRLMDAEQNQNINVFDVQKTEFHQLIKDNKKGGELSADLAGYLKSVTSNFVQNGFTLSAPVDTTVNGTKVSWVETEGKYGDKEVYFLIAGIEGAANYYQISCWTPLTKKQEYRNKFMDVVSSLREVN